MTGITAGVSTDIEKKYQESVLKMIKRFLDICFEVLVRCPWDGGRNEEIRIKVKSLQE